MYAKMSTLFDVRQMEMKSLFDWHFCRLADSHSVCDCFVPCNPTLLLPTSMCAKGIGYLENKKLSKIESNYS